MRLIAPPRRTRFVTPTPPNRGRASGPLRPPARRRPHHSPLPPQVQPAVIVVAPVFSRPKTDWRLAAACFALTLIGVVAVSL